MVRAGSMSRGTAMSTRNSGRWRRVCMAGGDLLGANEVAARASKQLRCRLRLKRCGKSSQPASAPCPSRRNCAANSCARSKVRLATKTRCAPDETRCLRRARRHFSGAQNQHRVTLEAARKSAARVRPPPLPTLKAPRPMAVSVRARLPHAMARRNSSSKTLLARAALRAISKALLTWPRISLSPKTSDSMPLATRNKCRADCAS